MAEYPIRDDDDALRGLLADGVSAGLFPGAVALVGGRGFEPATAVVGDRLPERGEPVTADTRFDCASLTKPVVTTTLVFQLLEAGEIVLDDTIGDHLDRLAGTDRGAVTVEELLTHTSGFQPYLYDDSWETPADAEEALYEADVIDGPAGESFEYSCLNFVHLTLVVEELTGEPLDRLASRRIFDRLGMDGAALWHDALDDGPTAATYDHDRSDRYLHGETHDPLARALGGYGGNAGLFATADDLGRFAGALLPADDGDGSGARILSRTAVETFRRERKRSDDGEVAQGYGWRTGTARTPSPTWSRDSIGHTGYTGTSLWINLRRQWFAVLLTNAVYNDSDMGRFRERFHAVAGAVASTRRGDWRGDGAFSGGPY